MRVTLKELLDRLGVGYVLSPYETSPWSVYDADKALTCSAEVRMGPDGDEVEVEMQFVYDAPADGKPPVEQIFYMYCKPSTDKWSPVKVLVRGKDTSGQLHNWEEKHCNFFNACVQELKMNNIPDIDELLEREVHGGERYGGRAGGAGSKAPKIKPQKLLGMKQGRGF